MHHIPPQWTSFSNCTATSPAVLHHRLPDHFQHTTVHQHRWFIGATTRPQPSLIARGFWTSFHEAINTAWRCCLPRSVHFARSFSVLTTPERSSLSPHCLFRAACSLKTPFPAISCPQHQTPAHTHTSVHPSVVHQLTMFFSSLSCFTTKINSLLIGITTFLVLCLCLHVVDGVTGLRHQT